MNASKNTSSFEPIRDKFSILTYFSDAIKASAHVEFWTKDQKISFNGKITKLIRSEKGFGLKTPADFNEDQFIEKLGKFHNFCFFGIAMENGKLFFAAELDSTHATSLKFLYPDKLFRIQRRKNMRVILSSLDLTITAEMQHPKSPWETLKLQVIDISTKGLAMMVPEAVVNLFQKGNLLKGFHFSFRAIEISTTAQVIQVGSSKSMKGQRFCRVSVIFNSRSQETNDGLTSVIMNIHKEFMEGFIHSFKKS